MSLPTEREPQRPEPRRIGIIADSHGSLAAAEGAIRLLRTRGAEVLVHLGDFCDSLRQDTAQAAIEMLIRNSVLAVKGNNDFLVETGLAGRRRPLDAEEEGLLAFLRDTPMVRNRGGIRFAHSLPFDHLRAFYEPIDGGDTRRAEALFAEADFRILFCGHSHRPVLFRQARGRVTREEVPAARPLALEEHVRHIFIAGSAAEGECALYDEAAGTYERLNVMGSGLGI